MVQRLSPEQYFAENKTNQSNTQVIQTQPGQVVVIRQEYVPIAVWILLGICVAGCLVLAYYSMRKK